MSNTVLAATPTLPPGQPLTVSAKRVVFYSDQYVVQAVGDVRVTLSDGTRLSGITFAMDLKLNRFVLAGDVHLKTTDGKDIPGAAFAEFFDFDRAYFIPIVQEPDRWTYIGHDYAHPLRGREMPGDTFYLRDLRGQHVFLYGRKALIVPRQSVRFTPAYVNLDPTNAHPAFLPTASYFLSFSANPNFAQNGLAGAQFDAPYPFMGGLHSLYTAHIRYDPINRVYLAYEQHLAITDRSYLVLSVNPITRPQKEYNLLAMDHLSPKVQVQLFMQEDAFQFGFSQPRNAGAFGQLQVTAGLRQSFLQLNEDQYWDTLLAGPPPCSGPECAWVPYHPFDAQLSWTSFDHRIAPQLYLQLHSGYGVAHNSEVPEQILGGVSYPTIWQHFVGFIVYTPSLPLRTPPFRNWYVNAVVSKQRQWFSSPHYIDTTSTTLSASKSFNPRVSGFISANVTNVGDYYGAEQSLVYPPPAVPYSPVTGQYYPGYTSFRGISTTRSLTESVIWSPSAAFTLNVTGRENHDFPDPIPYLPSLPGYGPPSGNAPSDVGIAPAQLSFDMHIRISSNLLIDLTRSYYFNYGNRRWSPQFGVLVTR
ncbi:MAG TPA: hypothetical protein VME66_16125 [Candidatus Acidoferrales bacterium]|nr:hypothetical protein [Candidatus Acidoferrales bacterium]